MFPPVIKCFPDYDRKMTCTIVHGSVIRLKEDGRTSNSKDGAPIFYPMFRHPGTLSVELLATGIGAMYNEQVFVPSPDGIKPEKKANADILIHDRKKRGLIQMYQRRWAFLRCRMSVQ